MRVRAPEIGQPNKRSEPALIHSEASAQCPATGIRSRQQLVSDHESFFDQFDEAFVDVRPVAIPDDEAVSIDRTTGSRSSHWPLSSTCSAAANFARLSWISIRPAATVIRSTISWKILNITSPELRCGKTKA